MTAPKENNVKVQEAGRWLASTPREKRPSPIIPALRSRYDLSTIEAVAAIREAVLLEGRAN